MSPILKMLRDEIDHLKVERSNLLARRSELIAPLDVGIAHVEERLAAAERMLRTYLGADANASPTGDVVVGDATVASIDAVEIPSVLKGHRVRSNSKRAAIIRATKVFLQVNGRAQRSEILEFVSWLGIMAHEKNPKAYLSVVLSHAREIFDKNGEGWYLRESPDPVDAGPGTEGTIEQ